jgi:hypothetical protein
VDHLSLTTGVLHERFGQLHHFLGISVQRQPTGLFLSQRQYMMEIFERAGMVDCKPCTTLVNTSSKLSCDTGDPVSNPTHYRSLVRALQYLTFTRLDISYVVQQVCLHMHNLRAAHDCFEVHSTLFLRHSGFWSSSLIIHI